MARAFASGQKIVLATATNIANPGGTITLSAWFNQSSRNGAQINWIWGVNDNTNFSVLTTETATNNVLYLCRTTSGTLSNIGGTTYSPSVWNHTAFSYDSTNGMLTYLNGISDGTVAAAGTVAAGTGEGGIGNDPPGGSGLNRQFLGSIADCAAWNTHLTAAEILALARGARPWTIRSANLIGWLPLDGLQSPEPDYSGNAYNGTVTSATLAAGPPVMQFTPRWPQVGIAISSSFNPAWARGRNTLSEGLAT